MAEDAQGNIATGFSGNVTVALVSNPGSDTLGGTLSASATGGVATFSNLTLNNVDSGYTLGVSSGGLTSAKSNAITVTPGTITVTGSNSGTNDNVSITFIDATHFTVNGTSTTYSTTNDNKFAYNGPTGTFSKFVFQDTLNTYTVTQTV